MLPRLLDKYATWISLGLLTLLAYVQAWGVTALLAASLVGAPKRTAPESAPAKSLVKPRSASSVLHRSPLDILSPPLDERSQATQRLAEQLEREESAAAARPIYPARSSAPLVADNFASLLSHVRIVPAVQDGKPVGVLLFGIRPDTLLALLGLENGDRLEAVNDYPLATPGQALAAYSQLRQAPRIALSINRHGRPLTIKYDLI